MQQQAGFVFTVRGDAAGEIAIRNRRRKVHGLAQRTGNGTHDKPANQAACRHAEEGDEDQQQTVAPEIALHLHAGVLHLGVLNRNQRLHFGFIGLLQF